MSSMAILATSSKLLFGYCYVFIEIVIIAVVSKKFFMWSGYRSYGKENITR